MLKLEEALAELKRNVEALVAEVQAELARLKPSGQVAEDVEKLRRWSSLDGSECWTVTTEEAQAAIQRLATKAQGYDAAVAEQARLKAIAEQADTERAYAQSQTQHERSLKDAAVADNARLLGLIIGMEEGDADEMMRAKLIIRNRGERPGAALLEVVSLLREYQSRDEPDVLTTLKRILEERRR